MPPTIKHGRNIGDQEKHILVKVMNRVTTCARQNVLQIWVEIFLYNIASNRGSQKINTANSSIIYLYRADGIPLMLHCLWLPNPKP